MSDLNTVARMASMKAQPLGSSASENVARNLNVDRYRDGSLTAEKTAPTRTGLPKQPDTDHQLVPNSNPVVQQHIKQLQQHVAATTSVLNVLDNAMTSGDKDEIQLAIHKGERVRASTLPVENGDIPLFTANSMMANSRSANNPPANNAIISPFKAVMAAGKNETLPDTELWNKAVSRIDAINNIYLNAHVHASDVYSRFYNDYNTKVVGKLNGYMQTDKGAKKDEDKNRVYFGDDNPEILEEKRDSPFQKWEKVFDVVGDIQWAALNCAKQWYLTDSHPNQDKLHAGEMTASDIPDKTVWPSFKIPATEKEPGIKSGSISPAADSNTQDPLDSETGADFIENPPNSGQYYPTRAGATRWAKEFGLPGSCVQKIKDAGWVVLVDTEPLLQIDGAWYNNSYGAHHTRAKLNFKKWGFRPPIAGIYYTSTEYQDIRTITTASETRMKSTIESIGTRYSNANNTYNNLVKILSSTIQITSESAKDFLRI